ncbi:hypothetical protein OIU77_026199 [Salix suchowensis]|uniref:Uncharacterized protein n=1 Tax=Salix suchowensis TaxID=1278906 RepID=A0ABQ9C314_9ROSI|nr:hypothetical protein OIU77_026199 [Salix suchowensis]
MAAMCRSLALALMVSRFTGIMVSDDDPYDAICSPIWGYFPDCAEYLGGLTITCRKNAVTASESSMK